METVESGNQRQVLDLDQEDALKGCKKVEKFESQGVFSVDLGNEEPNREILQSRILEEPKKSMRIEVQMEERVMDSTQEVAKSCKSVGKFESQRVLSVDLENEEQDREALYRGVMLMEPRRKSTRGEVSEEQKVKRLREAPTQNMPLLFGHCPFGGGGLDPCQDGLGHLFREELSKFKWAFA